MKANHNRNCVVKIEPGGVSNIGCAMNESKSQHLGNQTIKHVWCF